MRRSSPVFVLHRSTPHTRVNTYGYAGANPISAIDFFGLAWQFLGWQVETAQGLMRIWSNFVNVNALCHEDCTGKRATVNAYSWQTPPMCIGDPNCSATAEYGTGLKGLIAAGGAITSAAKNADNCGVLNGYQCFLANSTQEQGKKLCQTLK
jgi:hypothetical protein